MPEPVPQPDPEPNSFRSDTLVPADRPEVLRGRRKEHPRPNAEVRRRLLTGSEADQVIELNSQRADIVDRYNARNAGKDYTEAVLRGEDPEPPISLPAEAEKSGEKGRGSRVQSWWSERAYPNLVSYLERFFGGLGPSDESSKQRDDEAR